MFGAIKENAFLCSVNAAKRSQTTGNSLETTDMSIDTYKLTSTEEPTDDVLSQLMREAAEEARETNAQATQRYFNELRRAAANIR
jgi:hypothetical protein